MTVMPDHISDLSAIYEPLHGFYEPVEDGSFALTPRGAELRPQVDQMEAEHQAKAAAADRQHAKRMEAQKVEMARLDAENLRLAVEIELHRALVAAGYRTWRARSATCKPTLRRWPAFVLQCEGGKPTAVTADGLSVTDVVRDLLAHDKVVILHARARNPWIAPPQTARQMEIIATNPERARRLAIEAGVPPDQIWWVSRL